mgnify:CR=1 FL=1
MTVGDSVKVEAVDKTGAFWVNTINFTNFKAKCKYDP